MKLFKKVIIAALVFSAVFFAATRFMESKYKSLTVETVGISQETEEKTGGKIELQRAIVESMAEKKELVTFEAELSEEIKWDESWGNAGIFKKSQRVKLYGTGVYICDLSNFTANNVEIDDNFYIAEITIPHAKVKAITIDEDKTEYMDVEKGWLRFGDIKMTQEQHDLMYSKVKEAMSRKLDSVEMTKKADEATVKAVEELFGEIMGSTGTHYDVRVYTK